MLQIMKKIAMVIAVAFLAGCASEEKRSGNDIYANSVKVTNTAENHGGSGIVLRSSDTESYVLTNAHVCGVVENGGVVSGRTGKFMVTGYKKSEAHDLCLIKVAGNLGYHTIIAKRPPVLQYENASISGHPALFPNVITKGHFSGKQIVSILVGVRPCTEEEARDPSKELMCVFLGGMPIIKQYEATLVTATIMPGSSGSGVYNSESQLSGVAFAGSGQIGYALTVPYEAVINFLYKEQRNLRYVRPSNTVEVNQESEGKVETFLLRLKKVCDSKERSKIERLCELSESDILK